MQLWTSNKGHLLLSSSPSFLPNLSHGPTGTCFLCPVKSVNTFMVHIVKASKTNSVAFYLFRDGYFFFMCFWNFSLSGPVSATFGSEKRGSSVLEF